MKSNRYIVAQLLILFVTSLEVYGIYYLTLPALTIHSLGFWLWIFSSCVTAAINGGIWHFINYYDDRCATIDEGKEFFKQNAVMIVALIIVAVILVAMIITAFTGSRMFNAYEYAELTSISEGSTFESDFESLSDDTKNLVAVDQKTAQKLGDRTIGTIANASWYDVDDEYNLCEVAGEYVRISPVNYVSFFSQRKVIANGGIPGYVSVNAKTQEAKYIEFSKGMKYSPSGCFRYDLKRCIRRDFASSILSNSFFEVDDSGNPYWITGVLEPQIGLRGGKTQNGVIITDAITGENTYYAMKDLPEWVDHAYSVDYLMTRIGWHYYYANGYFNFSKTNRYRTSYSYKDTKNSSEENKSTPFDGYNSIVSKDGEICFETGITPVNSAETNIGFVTVSARTGEVKFYAVEGAEESSAQAAAEGLVQNLRYSASFPILVNVSGEESYFMVLKDDAGLVKKYSLCSVENYTICVEADSIEETIFKYLVAIGKKATETSVTENVNEEEVDVETQKISGIVSKIEEAQLGGYSYYYFTLNDEDGIVYMSSIQNSNLQPMKLVVGAKVDIEFSESSSEKGIAIVQKISFN